jgi:hypothetical protein
MTFPTVTLKRAPNSQVRIGITEFKGEQRIDIREWRIFDGKKDYGPTKHGVTVPMHIAKDFGAAVTAAVAAAPNRVVDLENATRWVICKSKADAQFHKKNVYASEAEARTKSPPDGYSIYKILVADGVVTRTRQVAERAKQKWRTIESAR